MMVELNYIIDVTISDGNSCEAFHKETGRCYIRKEHCSNPDNFNKCLLYQLMKEDEERLKITEGNK